MNPIPYRGIGPSSAERFSSLGFAVGLVRGYRTWRADSEGWLRGMYYPQVWWADGNVAVCRKRQGHGALGSLRDMDLADYETPTRGHLAECVCGLHGYYEGSNDYYKPSRRTYNVVTEKTVGAEQPNLVEGMAEGFGEVLIGTRGFKAKNARIAALVFPDTLVAPSLILSHYPDVPVFSTFEQMIEAFPAVKGTE